MSSGGKGRRRCSAGFTGCGHETGKAVAAVLLQHWGQNVEIDSGGAERSLVSYLDF